MAYQVQVGRTLAQASVIAYADFRAFYTWKTWAGWLVRLLAQVAFYGLLASWLGNSAYITTVVLGAALLICVTESMMAVASTTWDRLFVRSALLLAASPVRPGVFYVGRSLQWPCSAVVTTSITLGVMSLFFDVTWSLAQVPVLGLLVALNAFTGYCMALLIGAAALVAPAYRNVMSNTAVMVTTAFCGAFVPVSFWPAPLQWLAYALPATHGIEAVRLLQAGAGSLAVGASAGLAAMIGVAWLLAALFCFQWQSNHARRTGAWHE